MSPERRSTRRLVVAWANVEVRRDRCPVVADRTTEEDFTRILRGQLSLLRAKNQYRHTLSNRQPVVRVIAGSRLLQLNRCGGFCSGGKGRVFRSAWNAGRAGRRARRYEVGPPEVCLEGRGCGRVRVSIH